MLSCAVLSVFVSNVSIIRYSSCLTSSELDPPEKPFRCHNSPKLRENNIQCCKTNQCNRDIILTLPDLPQGKLQFTRLTSWCNFFPSRVYFFLILCANIHFTTAWMLLIYEFIVINIFYNGLSQGVSPFIPFVDLFLSLDSVSTSKIMQLFYLL